jgi:polysaccharide transporter, PST family
MVAGSNNLSESPGPVASMRRKAFTLGAARALVRLICGFISVKITAVYLGPSGLALIAQFNNFMTLCQSVVSTGLETAASRLTAEYGSDAARRRVLLGTVGKIGFSLGVPLALAVAVTSPWLASWLLKDARYAWVFVLAAILNGVLLATLSARGDIVRMAGSNMLGTVCGLLIFAPAAVKWGVTGGLFAASAVYLCSLLLTLILISSSTLVRVRDFIGRFDRAEARRIAAFYPMLVLHAVMSPLSLILIREHVASSLSLESAGLWQACWRLSETYLMVVMSSVTTQFMPRSAARRNAEDLGRCCGRDCGLRAGNLPVS